MDATSSVEKPGQDSQSATVSKALSPHRRERKRATDRESQRLSRARVKAYIAHLERSVEELTKTSSSDTSVAVTKQLKEQFEEIQHLKGIISSISKLSLGVDCARIARDPTRSNHSMSDDEDDDASGPFQPTGNDGADPFKPFDDLRAQPGNMDHPLSQHPRSPKTQGANWVADPIHDSSTTEVDNGLTSNMYLRPLSFHEENRNYFEVLSNILSVIERSDNRGHFSGQEVDDDITIRAVLHGWAAARKTYEFDIAWQFLEAVDRSVFHRSGPVERIATLRTMRSMLMVGDAATTPLSRSWWETERSPF